MMFKLLLKIHSTSFNNVFKQGGQVRSNAVVSTTEQGDIYALTSYIAFKPG